MNDLIHFHNFVVEIFNSNNQYKISNVFAYAFLYFS